MKKIVCLLFSLLLCVSLLPVGTVADGPTPAPENVKYVDFDDMSFWVNGQKFTLGVNTLQDMIDAGVVFDEEDLEDADNNLRKNMKSETFRFDLTENGYATVKVINDTKKGKRLADCVLSQLYVSFWKHPEELEESILSMSFPLSITKEQLLENAGEADESSHSDYSDYYADYFTYKKSAKKYFGYNKFSFTFRNGALDSFTVEYLP